MPATITHSLDNLAATQKLASQVAEHVASPCVITLTGDLGTGKTTFSRFFIQALTHQDTDVTSPTFTLLQQYDCPKGEIWHYDLYRLKHREESYELAIEDAFMHAITLIEWPAIIEPLLPSERLDITLKHDDGNSDKRLAILTIPDTLQALTNELSNE